MKPSRLLTKPDIRIIIILTLVFAIVDFIGLGNTTSPETFVDFSQSSAFVTFDQPVTIQRMDLFTGVRTGVYYFDFSSDGIHYERAAEFDQNYGEVLRWENVYTTLEMTDVRYVKITASGDPYLGEILFFDNNGVQLSCTCTPKELCDEQDKGVERYSYMNSTYFDEIYHARTAWEHLNLLWPYEISHPPLGKLIIALGISLLGMTPFGWRFSGTLFGVLMLPLIYTLLKKMYNSTWISTCATVIFATDFMHYVQTRIATIDTYSVFFIIAMYLFMYLFVSEGNRGYLGCSGVAFGLGAACKWTSLYAGVGLAVIWLIYHLKHRDVFIKNALYSVLFFVLIPAIIYYLSYIPYGLALGYTSIFSKDYFKMVIANQEYMFSYHSSLVAEHPYSSRWYQWIFNIRPILYFLDYLPDGTRSSFGAFMNPVLCIGGLSALLMAMFDAVTTRDKNAVFLSIGYLSQLVPWMFVDRITFEYHYFPCGVFLTLAVGYIFQKFKNEKRFMVVFTSASIALFVYFYPVLRGLPVPADTKMYGWLKTWPF